MTDGEKSITELTQSFTYIANQLQNIVNTEGNESAETQLQTLKHNTAKLSLQLKLYLSQKTQNGMERSGA